MNIDDRARQHAHNFAHRLAMNQMVLATGRFDPADYNLTQDAQQLVYALGGTLQVHEQVTLAAFSLYLNLLILTMPPEQA